MKDGNIFDIDDGPDLASDFDMLALGDTDEDPEAREQRLLRKRTEELEKFLANRFEAKEKPYGIFEADVTMCRFFGSQDGDKFLAEIEGKNAELGSGNYQIPGTEIRLINYSVCPKCSTVFSFVELKNYFQKPESSRAFKDKRDQYRNDTRMRCGNCGTYFLPSLVIADGTPRNEVQFLCRMQTVQAIEKFLAAKGRTVLTKNKSNIVKLGKGRGAVYNDVLLGDLTEKPALASNLIQYTPANIVLHMMDDSGSGTKQYLFGSTDWKV